MSILATPFFSPFTKPIWKEKLWAAKQVDWRESAKIDSMERSAEAKVSVRALAWKNRSVRSLETRPFTQDRNSSSVLAGAGMPPQAEDLHFHLVSICSL